jgi:hypothetical protein
MFDQLPIVNFQEDKHILTRENGKVLQSVSKFLARFEPEFDSSLISWMMARKQLRLLRGWKKGDPDIPEEEIQVRKAEILAEWDALRDDAADHGHGIHKVMEDAIISRKSENWQVQRLLQEYGLYYQDYKSEIKLCHPLYGLGGITDMAGIRKGKDLVVDVEDYKSNKRKGITYMSGKIDDKGVFKFYNEFFKAPIQHLEHCNYVRNCLQISIYAYLLELLLNCKIGRLAFRFIDLEDEDPAEIMSINYHPIPYMRDSVINMIQSTLAIEHSEEGGEW